MKLVFQRSFLGETPYYLRVSEDSRVPIDRPTFQPCENSAANPTEPIHGATIRELLEFSGETVRAVDPIGLKQYFERQPDGVRTCFRNVKLLGASADLFTDGPNLCMRPRELPEIRGPLLPLLEQVTGELVSGSKKVAVALSGGLDSVLVLALTRKVSGRPIPAITLATRLDGYCELEQTLKNARMLGIPSVEVIEAGLDDLVFSFPIAIQACETPLFNLHPVSKLLLAQGAAARGYDAILTGDGADQAFAGADPRNYLPIVGSLVRAAGVRWLSPFLDDRVVSWARRSGIDAEKRALREAALEILTSELASLKKTPRLMPDCDLNQFRDRELERGLSAKASLPVADQGPGPVQTLWASTAILMRHLGGTW